MKNFDEYRNFYDGNSEGGNLPVVIPEGMPEPKTYKEWAVATLCGLNFDMPVGLEPKTPIEKYLAYAVDQSTISDGISERV